MKRLAFRSILLAALLLFGAAEAALAYNSYVFPQFANGSFGSTAIRTRYTFGGTATLNVTFYNTDGSYKTVTLQSAKAGLNGTGSSFSATLAGDEVVTCLTSGTGGLSTGWALVYATSPFTVCSSGYCYYRTDISNPPMDWEVAIPPARATSRASIEAVIAQDDPLPGQNTDMSFAVANPNNVSISIVADLGDGNTRTITLPALGQTAIYLKSLFSGYNFGTNYRNSVMFQSAYMFHLMGLRAVNHATRSVYSYLPITTEIERGRESTFEHAEPNGSYSTARDIHTLPAVVTGSFCAANDRDSYTLVGLKAGANIHAALFGDILGTNSNVSVILEFWDSSSHLLATGVALPWSPYDRTLEYTVPADGNYSVDVIGSTAPAWFPFWPAEYTLCIYH